MTSCSLGQGQWFLLLFHFPPFERFIVTNSPTKVYTRRIKKSLWEFADTWEGLWRQSPYPESGKYCIYKHWFLSTQFVGLRSFWSLGYNLMPMAAPSYSLCTCSNFISLERPFCLHCSLLPNPVDFPSWHLTSFLFLLLHIYLLFCSLSRMYRDLAPGKIPDTY